MRKYQPNEYTGLWFTTFMWSTIFLHLCKEVSEGGGGEARAGR